MASSLLSEADDPVDEDAGRRHQLRVDGAERRDLADLDDAELGRHRHGRVEVARRLAIGEVAPAVGAVRLEESDVALQRRLEDVAAAVDLALLLADSQLRPDPDRRI